MSVTSRTDRPEWHGAPVTDDVLSDGMAVPVIADTGSSAYTPGVSRHTGSGTTFEGADYLGTNRVETNSSQSVTGTRTYDAFGNLESTTGSPIGQFGYVGQWGYQADGDSGLLLLGHRYYDPSTGRFLTRDSAKDGRNWFAYVSGLPTNSVDPTGLWSLWKWLMTDDGNAADNVVGAGNMQALVTLENFGKNFGRDLLELTPVYTMVGGLPKFIPRKLGLVRDIPLEGEDWATSWLRVLSANSKWSWAKLGAQAAKRSSGEMPIFAAAILSINSSVQTLKDPVWFYPEESKQK